MNKAKLVDFAIKGGALLLAGVVTVLNNKSSENAMKDAVAKEVAEALANQAKES